MKIDKRIEALEAVTTENKVLGLIKVDGKIRVMGKKEIYNSIEQAREVYPDHKFIIYTIMKRLLHLSDEDK